MFKRLLNKKQVRQGLLNRLVLFLNSLLERRAKRVANILSDKAQKLSDKQLLRRLYLFAIIGISLNAVIIVAAFTGHPYEVKIPANNITTPGLKSSGHSFKQNQKEQSAQVRKLNKFLDSLEKTETGRQQLLRFMEEHPGFKDSLQRFKNLFSGT